MISSEYIQTAMQDWNVPGLSIAVVKDGKILLTAGFGQCNVDRPAPVNERSLFTIGSCTKAFATTALAILVEEKLLSWEDPLRKFIPGFSLPSDSEGSALTLAEIVSHQSGVEDGAISDLPCATLDEALAHLRQIKAQGKRGVGMTYNNTLFASLALVIEKTTGMPWSDFMHERIFQPLAMNDSFSMEADRYKGNEHKCNQAFP
ncbi:MAG: beta-lactamase family protein, partial [Candidatus Melainabacteria bacterium]|nr:beta-lactamase family protein [Candidatus Melainabacteria bacterium]